ncbi:NAD(P)-binding protein, partial [candidate division KSB1 bacterium]|nr:NAD(P)-binding protein [candidate division KSB1 bacterium]
MSDSHKEIKILGAGPAGLSAAINLAKSNFKVSVFEHQEKS